MTWSTVIITPLTFLFPQVKEATLSYEWFVDGVWCVEICLSFFKGHIVFANTLEKTVKRYMTDGPLGIGPLWFDVASTLPAMIFMEKSLKVNALKFLRLYHLNEMFFPVELLTRKIFEKEACYY